MGHCSESLGEHSSGVGMRIFSIGLLGIFLALAGCGFQLRGTHSFSPSLQCLYLETTAPNSPLVLSLKERLAANQVELVAKPALATAVLHLLSVTQTQQATSLIGSGQATNYTLTETVTFSVTEEDSGRVLYGPRTLRASENYSSNASLVLSDAYRQNTVGLHLEQSLVGQIFTILQGISSNETSSV